MRELIPVSAPSITDKEIEYVTDAVRSGWVSSLGRYIDTFETRFAQFCGTAFGIATCNGTTALHLALAAYEIGADDEVIVPDLTFIATANAVRYLGARPVFVDIERDSLCLDPDKLRAAITPRTRAVIPVHLYGHPANMREIVRIATEHDLVVVEDAAEAHGAEIEGRRVGSFGHAGVFSFYGNKIMTAGEGGMITTNDRAFAERARHLRDHAMRKDRRYWHDQVGFNYRITNLQAALAVAQLERGDELLARRRTIFECYRSRLEDVEGVQLNRTAIWAKNAYWMVCVELAGFDVARRTRLTDALRARGIDSRPYFYPVSEMPMYAPARTPVAHAVSSIGINLPSYFDLTDAQIAFICAALIELIRE